MQGLQKFIPTKKKVAYIDQLLKVGFDTIDLGSFVSHKAVPQMKDTADVLNHLNLSGSESKLLSIVANKRGAEDACSFEKITYLGYPFSISETFQKRNTNASIDQSLERVEEIQALCVNHGKTLVIYISMAFGNPYGDDWSGDIASHWVEKLVKEQGIQIISLADTIGVSSPQNIKELFSSVLKDFPGIEIGAHLHSKPESWREKVEAAYATGCRKFDAAIMGLGGCPMAGDHLTGNLATENLITFLRENETVVIDEEQFNMAVKLAATTLA